MVRSFGDGTVVIRGRYGAAAIWQGNDNFCSWYWCCSPCLALQERAVPRFFPFAVYDKSELPPDSGLWRDYQTRLLNALVQNNINAIVIQPYRNVTTTLQLMDAAQARGVRVIMSVGNPLNPSWDYIDPRKPFFPAYRHPSVIAFKYGDEPDDEADLRVLENAYSALTRHVRAPVFTVLVGEQMRFVEGEIAIKAWSRLRAPLRVARFYPLRKSYDLQRWPADKMKAAVRSVGA